MGEQAENTVDHRGPNSELCSVGNEEPLGLSASGGTDIHPTSLFPTLQLTERHFVHVSVLCLIFVWSPNWDASPMRTGTLLVRFTGLFPVLSTKSGTKWALCNQL